MKPAHRVSYRLTEAAAGDVRAISRHSIKQ